MSDAPNIRVLIVDDHPLFADALVRAVNGREDMSVVARVESGEAALEVMRERSPSVCVLDLGLPDIRGEVVLERVVAEELPTRILILSGECDSETVYGMIEAGAAGFEVKTAGTEEIGEAIAVVAKGETFLPATLHGAIADQIRAHRVKQRSSLSSREVEILQLVSNGLSASEIGDQLGLAESTAKTHLARIYDKLGVSERAAAVAQAMRAGIIR